MKKLQLSFVSAAVAIMAGFTPMAISSSAMRIGQYDFSYLTSGEIRATPVQVFDDGKSTFFQFRAGEAIPAIFNSKEGKVGLLVPSFEGPYIKVSEVGGRFTLQLGRSQAHVVYAGGGREGVPPINAVASNGMSSAYKGGYPADQNVKLVASLGPAVSHLDAGSLEANSYATPVKGDRVTWKDAETKSTEHKIWFQRGNQALGPAASKDIAALMPAIKQATRVTIVGRDDDTYKEGLEQARAQSIKAALVKAGIPQERIVIKTGVQSEPSKGLWASDIRIETVLPTQISRSNDASANSGYVKSNVDNLVRAGVLTKDQALAILRRAGETAEKAAPAAPATVSRAIEVPPDGFDFKASDKTVSTSIKRWASATNYQVVWDAPPAADAPVTGDAVIASNSMKEALEKVVAGLQRKGYDIQATVYTNRVIRFTGGSK